MAYATAEQVMAGFRTLTDEDLTKCNALLDEAGIMIDVVASDATADAKRVVSCRMVRRAMGDSSTMQAPMGATQGSVSALGYAQSWTISNGSAGELYIGKSERMLLGLGNKIGCSNPFMEDEDD